jgi:hypothetical protein
LIFVEPDLFRAGDDEPVGTQPADRSDDRR